MTVAPRRRPNLAAAVLVGSLCAPVLAAGLGWGVWELNNQRHAAAAAEARQQRFVDTAQQTVVNMFSYTQDDIDKSVNTFVDGTSGPLRDMLSQNQNVDNLKAMFRDTRASLEAVVNGAAAGAHRRDERQRIRSGGCAGHRHRHRRGQQAVRRPTGCG